MLDGLKYQKELRSLTQQVEIFIWGSLGRPAF